MKSLLMITTGGTIASERTDKSTGEGLAPAKSGAQLLPELDDARIDVLDLYALDSTDVTPAHWRRLYDAVTENLPLYDGIVILHGTDTMAYTGAVLALTVGSEKPVILTGSMIPFGAPDSDAQYNIVSACECALSEQLHGVWLTFGKRLIGGADIVKVSSSDKDAFRSYSGFAPSETFPFPADNALFPAVIKLAPFTCAADIKRAAEGHCGAVIETYGTGGLPAGEITDAVCELAKKICVIITTHCLGGTDLERYAVGQRAINAGAAEGGKMSSECAAVHLWLTQGQ